MYSSLRTKVRSSNALAPIRTTTPPLGDRQADRQHPGREYVSIMRLGRVPQRASTSFGWWTAVEIGVAWPRPRPITSYDIRLLEPLSLQNLLSRIIVLLVVVHKFFEGRGEGTRKSETNVLSTVSSSVALHLRDGHLRDGLVTRLVGESSRSYLRLPSYGIVFLQYFPKVQTKVPWTGIAMNLDVYLCATGNTSHY